MGDPLPTLREVSDMTETREIIAKNRVRITEETTVRTAFDEARRELEMLKDEMREWEESLSGAGTGLDSTQKYGDVSDCADTLECAFEEVDSIDAEALPETPLTVSYIYPRRRNNIGRSWRLGIVTAQLEAVGKSLGAGEDSDTLRTTAAELEGLDFPGMF